MKKVFLILAFALIAMFAFNNVTTASTVAFKLRVTDNGGVCPIPYTGTYHITVRIYVDGNFLCSYDEYDIVNTSDNPISFSCDGPFSQYSTYAMYITIRRNNVVPDCQSTSNWQGLNMNDLTNPNTLYTIITN
jgi:hypothetical protein